MDKITRNIARHEVACNCGCGFDTLDYQTAQIIQGACDYFGAIKGRKSVLIPHSGCRCFAWNDHEGGAEDSQHLYGRAFDHHIVGVTPQELYDYYDKTYPGKFGIGLYRSFVHFDTRTEGVWRQGL